MTIPSGAFSSEAETGSREEKRADSMQNATKQKDGAFHRFPETAKRSRPRRFSRLLLGFLLVFLLPVGWAAAGYWLGGRGPDWSQAGRASAGILPRPAASPQAVVRVFAARTVRWRGIFATHTWIVVKEAGAARYDRFDYTAWGEPVRTNGFAPDALWFGSAPELVFAADGEMAERAIPKIRAAVAGYAHSRRGDYRAWPGPNSNTFVAAVMAAVPELEAALPPTAIGKDFPHDGRWLAPAIGGYGLRATLAGYAGLTLGWYEGIEVNILGAVIGLDLRRPAIKLPAVGRIGLPPAFL